MDPNRVYDDHQHGRSVRQDDAIHVAFLVRSHRHPRASHGHRRVARVSLHPAQTGLVQPPHRYLTCSPGIVHTCVRVPRIHTVREARSAIRRAHYF